MSTRTHESDAPQDEAELFRAAVADAKPVPGGARAELRRPRPAPVPHQRLKDERDVLEEALARSTPWSEDIDHTEAQSFLRPGLPRHILRRLRGGHWVVQNELDLHGLRTDEAKTRVIDFLAECKRMQMRCLRIVHGKGLRSKNREPVLKHKVRRWLMQRDEILAFVEARPVAGGSGAVVVLLKSASKALSKAT